MKPISASQLLLLILIWPTFTASKTLLTPTELNALRFKNNDALLKAHFKAVLTPTSPFVSNNECPSTPSDVKGPFHLPPENVPVGFPAREEACVSDPVCVSCQGHHGYDGGIPLLLTGEVFSAANCEKLSGEGVLADLWQADPSGAYWTEDDIWQRRRSARSNQTHHYNCRAHSEISNENSAYRFQTYLPGHYIAGSAWRPRHLHIRLQAPGFRTLVTQIYFHGDRFQGEDDTACTFCKSDHPALLVVPELQPENITFSLCDLPKHSVSSSGLACPVTTVTTDTTLSTATVKEKHTPGSFTTETISTSSSTSSTSSTSSSSSSTYTVSRSEASSKSPSTASRCCQACFSYKHGRGRRKNCENS
eukprot:m.175424 g.175424  ORF g.175424 m.175424 type:complete len:363 (+) comp15425_c0_seq2:132-1220(+)